MNIRTIIAFSLFGVLFAGSAQAMQLKKGGSKKKKVQFSSFNETVFYNQGTVEDFKKSLPKSRVLSLLLNGMKPDDQSLIGFSENIVLNASNILKDLDELVGFFPGRSFSSDDYLKKECLDRRGYDPATIPFLLLARDIFKKIQKDELRKGKLPIKLVAMVKKAYIKHEKAEKLKEQNKLDELAKQKKRLKLLEESKKNVVGFTQCSCFFESIKPFLFKSKVLLQKITKA